MCKRPDDGILRYPLGYMKILGYVFIVVVTDKAVMQCRLIRGKCGCHKADADEQFYPLFVMSRIHNI
jgi:hypothetical protein